MQSHHDALPQNIDALTKTSGVTGAVHTLQGEGVKGIRCSAVEESGDLVIVGRGRNRGAISRLWSDLYEIVREAPCPVLSALTGSCQPTNTLMDSAALRKFGRLLRSIDSVIGRLTDKRDQPYTLKLAGRVRQIVSPGQEATVPVWGKTRLSFSGFEPFPISLTVSLVSFREVSPG